MPSADLRTAARRTRPWIERLARLGYVAIGVVYGIVGALTAAAALHHGGKAADRQDAFAFILGEPFGSPLLLVIALGLLGYSVWKIASGITDSDSRGRDAKGLATRVGAIATGILYGGVMFEVLHLALRHSGGGEGSDRAAKHWSSRVLELPFGRWILALGGVVIAGAGIYQAVRAWKAKLGKRLDLSSLAPDSRRVVTGICRFGIAARAVVFFVIGVSILTAALRFDPSAARGTSGAFVTLLDQPAGRAILAVVAIGFIAYGIYAVVNARYRHIEAG